MGWHVEGDVLLRTAYRYGSTRLARLHWSGAPTHSVCVECTDWFETRSTAAHPERDMIQRQSTVHTDISVCVVLLSSLWFVVYLCMVAVC